VTSTAIVGAGFVGGNLATVLAERGLNVLQFDKLGKKSLGTNSRTFLSVSDLVRYCQGLPNFSGVVFVCVPTPMDANTGECDTSIVKDVLKDIADAAAKPIVAVIKSTIPPGTTDGFNNSFAETPLTVCHSPEFLREATALEDTRNQDRIIIGGSRFARDKVKIVFQAAFPNVPVYETNAATAEMIKYTANCFLATKVSFANEVYQICERAQVDYNEMIRLAMLDKRLGDSHWQVPGPMPCDLTGKPSRGFAGSCFVKDLNALIALATKWGVKATVMKAAWAKNLEVRPQRDWEKLKGRAVSVKPLTNYRYRIVKPGWLPIHPMIKPLADRIFSS
jgi:nucleotide sugar dehydrogenase